MFGSLFSLRCWGRVYPTVSPFYITHSWPGSFLVTRLSPFSILPKERYDCKCVPPHLSCYVASGLGLGSQACIVNGVYPLNQLLGPDLIVFEITKWHVIFSAYSLFKTVLETHGNASNGQFRWKSASHPWIQIAQSQLSIWVPYNHMNLMRQSERTVVQGWRAQRR